MMHFRPVSFIDTWGLASAVYRHRSAFDQNRLRQTTPGSPHHSTQTIFFRGPRDPSPENWFDDAPQVDYGLLGQKEWQTAKNVLSRIRRAVQATLPAGQELGPAGKAMIVLLKAGCHIDWHVDEGEYAEAHIRFHLPIVTNPGCALYSGGEVQYMPAGQLTWFDNRVKHSGTNLGAHPRVHLIVDFRKPEPV